LTRATVREVRAASTGRLSFKARIPENAGRLDPTGTSVTLKMVADGHAEVWVDGLRVRQVRRPRIEKCRSRFG
jgi:hypothetical protein